MRHIAGTLLMVAVAASAPQRTSTVTNGGFEQWRGDRPVGWSLVDLGGQGGLTLGSVPDGHGRAARFMASRDVNGLIAQQLDATPWRGKDVVVSARLRIAPGTRAGLSLEVTRPAPDATGFHDQNGERDLVPGVWRMVSKRGYVEADALTIRLGGAVAGKGMLDIDEVSIVEARPTDTPPSAEARGYLDQALAFMREHHMRTHAINWPLVTARAHRQIAGAKTPADTYWVIRGVLGTLGDHHSFFRLPPPPTPTGAKPATAAGRGVAPMPTTRLVAERIGLVSLPWLSTFGPDGAANGRRYVSTARAGLSALDARPLCGWIIDLRGDEGGDMWPMLNAVAPLLGDGPYGAFVTPDGEVEPWVMKSTGITVASDTGGRRPSYEPFTLRQAALPLAVLTSGDTGSSGETVTLALAGRARSRRFGAATAGYLSGNATDTLPDGAVLAIASVWERDRTGRDYRERIGPEEPTAPDQSLPAAMRWLSAQCRR